MYVGVVLEREGEDEQEVQKVRHCKGCQVHISGAAHSSACQDYDGDHVPQETNPHHQGYKHTLYPESWSISELCRQFLTCVILCHWLDPRPVHQQ